METRESKATDPMAILRKEVGWVDFLDVAEGKRLFARVQRGVRAREWLISVEGDEDVSEADRVAVASVIEAGHEAENTILKSVYPFILDEAARRFGHGVAYLDLVQEGAIGALRALERFDSDRGTKFVTYAGWFIRQKMDRAIYNNSEDIRLPHHIQELARKCNKVRYTLWSMQGEEPTYDGIAMRLGIEPDEVRDALEAKELTTTVSISVLVSRKDHGGEDGSDLERFLADDNSLSTEARALNGCAREILESAIASLSEREQDILQKCIDWGMSSNEIGMEYGLTGSRIIQIVNRAFEKLRDSSWGPLLRELLDDL